MYMAEVRNGGGYYSQMAQFSLLVIDDDEVLLQAIQDAIQFRLPHVAVSTSPSPEEAIRLLTLHHYDVALSDIRMPLMDGYRLLSRIQSLKPAMPVLLMSGHLDGVRDTDAKQAGAFAILHKPLDRELLISQLQLAFQHIKQ
jgi:two-component system, NtrC family, nitrogen regulation response regulator NtrX